MNKLKNQLVGGLLSLIVLGGLRLPTVFANPDSSEETSSSYVSQFKKSSKPPRQPCTKYFESTEDLDTYYKKLAQYDSRLVHWASTAKREWPVGVDRCIDDIGDLIGAYGYVRYMLSKDSVENKFKSIETEIKNLKLNKPKLLMKEFLDKIHRSICNLEGGFLLATVFRDMVKDFTNNGMILDFSREKCKSVKDYVEIFTSDTIPEFIPPIINMVKSKFPSTQKSDLMNIGRILHRAFFRTMIYRLCIGEI